jgi:hypothetical protein
MVEVPAKTPVTKPVVLTLAFVELELVQALLVAGIPDPVSCV